jgi:hypothetical protein
MGFDLRTSHLSREQRAVLTAVLAIANDTRGGDSWGYYDFTTLYHGLGDLADKAMEVFTHRLVLCHTRKATQGSVTVENAHPFDIGNIVGAHNGIISNHELLNNKYNRKCTVDSQHLFHHLNEKKPFDDISGYGVATWVEKDSATPRIYLSKMSHGELAVYGIGPNAKNCRGVIYSSDEDHLKAAVGAAKVESFPYKIETGSVYYIENGKVFVDETRKLEITKNYSRDWRGGNTYPLGGDEDWGEWSQWRGAHAADNKSNEDDKPSTVVNAQDSALDAIINKFRSEEKERKEFVENLEAKIVKEESTDSDVKAKTKSDDKETEMAFDEKTQTWFKRALDGTQTKVVNYTADDISHEVIEV